MVIKVQSPGFLVLVMSINILQWLEEIEMFNLTQKTWFINEKSLRVVGLSSAFGFGIRFVFVVLMLFACGVIELDTGHKSELLLETLNGITVHNFAKIYLPIILSINMTYRNLI